LSSWQRPTISTSVLPGQPVLNRPDNPRKGRQHPPADDLIAN
jgi:hypothetical protein